MNFMVVCIAAVILYVDFSESVESLTHTHTSPLTTTITTIMPYHCEDQDTNGIDIHCYGNLLLEIPTNLNQHLKKLTVTDSDMKYIKRSSLDPYRETIRDV